MGSNSKVTFLVFCCIWLAYMQLKHPSVAIFEGVGPASLCTNRSIVPTAFYEQSLRDKRPLRLEVPYVPSSSETYAITHAVELGYHASRAAELTVPSCEIFTNPNLPVHSSLQSYRSELSAYNAKVRSFVPQYTDLRTPLRTTNLTRQSVCSTVDLGLAELFAESQQLSYGSFGYVEPLLPPMRDPEMCFRKGKLMSLEYMVHDWKVLCERLTPLTRTAFIDMGASLVFHGAQGITPAVYVLETYKKFGFHFDDVYAYEITRQDPAQVFRIVPEDLFPNYHWINVGVESDPNSKLNPLRMILNKYTEDDFVVIKLDIDTGTCSAWRLAGGPRAPHSVSPLCGLGVFPLSGGGGTLGAPDSRRPPVRQAGGSVLL